MPFSVLAQTGLSYQGFDIDSISDITGISMNKMDFVEQGSQHSGSFGSDNTDALLSVSLRDFEGDESLLESVSQVGADLGTSYRSPKDRLTSYGGNQHLKASVQHEGFSVRPGTHGASNVHAALSEDLSVHNGMPEAFLSKGSSTFQNFEQNEYFDQGFSSKGKNSGNLMNKASYMPRKFSLDSDNTISGRESVIKHHSSLPNASSESVAKATDFDRKHDHYVNGDGQGHTDQYLVNSHSDAKHQIKPMTENGDLSWGQSGLLRDNAQYMRDMKDHHETVKGDFRHRQGNIGDVYGNYGRIRGNTEDSRGEYNGYSSNQDGHEGGFISGTAGGVSNGEGYYESSASEGRGREEMSRSQDHLRDNSMEQRQAEEMLLGVKQDPETNGNIAG